MRQKRILAIGTVGLFLVAIVVYGRSYFKDQSTAEHAVEANEVLFSTPGFA